MSRRVFEVATTGIDEALQGLSSDPLGASFPSAAGLRIPPVLPGAPPQPRYLFCLATRTISFATRIRGMRQGATIGLNVLGNSSGPPYVVEYPISTPNFSFPDGNISWHLVFEPSESRAINRPQTDAPGWAFLDSGDSAMLYQSFTNSSVNPLTGAPIYYDIGLTTYTPPPISIDWQPVGGLGNFKDIRFPWNSTRAWDCLDIPIEAGGRVSLYASILQTNPATRATQNTPAGLGSVAPEETFITAYAPDEGDNAVIYWRVFGSLIFEDEVPDGTRGT